MSRSNVFGCGLLIAGLLLLGHAAPCAAVDLVPIQGRAVEIDHSAATALDRAREALLDAYFPNGSLRSWEEDRRDPATARTYGWDQCTGLAALVALGAPADRIDGAVRALAARINADGGFPFEPRTDPRSGATETACAVALLAGLVERGQPAAADPIARAAINRGADWLRATWQPSGGMGLGPGAERASTEGTAVAIYAGLALSRFDPAHASEWHARVLAATRLLTRSLWLGGHFARGVTVTAGGTPTLDADATGPHLHQALALLALARARAVLGEAVPSPHSFDPLPWLMRHFSREMPSAGRMVHGVGDRLTLADQSGVLYGCDGGTIPEKGEAPLACSAGTLRVADPAFRCWSPYDSCARPALDAPSLSSMTVLSNVNAEVSILAASAARSLGAEDLARQLLEGALRLQRPDGGVVAIAGPAVSAPGKALGYPQTHRYRSFGYTALLALLLADRDPLAPGVRLSDGKPLAAVLEPDGFDLGEIDLSGWLADPETGRVEVESEVIRLRGTTRDDEWIAWRQPEHRDNAIPLACAELRAQVRVEGPWRDLEITVSDAAGRTWGRTLRGFLQPRPTELSLPLDSLSFFWGPDAAGAARRFTTMSIVAKGAPPRSGEAESQTIELAAPRLAAVPCAEGGPIAFRAHELVADGKEGVPPAIRDLGGPAPTSYRAPDPRSTSRAPTNEPLAAAGVEVAFDLNEMRWQQIAKSGHWDWSCARQLELVYRADRDVTVQIKLEDGHVEPQRGVGARAFVEKRLERSDPHGVSTERAVGPWRESVSELGPFDAKDQRPLDLRNIQRVWIAFVPRPARPLDALRGTNALDDQRGTIRLYSLSALANPSDLAPDGSCRAMPETAGK